MKTIKFFLSKLYYLSTEKKKIIFIIFDFLISIFSIYFSFYLIYGEVLVRNYNYIFFLLFSSSSYFLFFCFFQIYSGSFRFFNIYNLYKIILAFFFNLIFLSVIIYLLKYFTINLTYGVSQSLILIYIVWFVFFATFGRVISVIIYESFINLKKKNIAIIGTDSYVKKFINAIEEDFIDIKYILNNSFDESLKKYPQIDNKSKFFQLIDNSFDALIISESYLKNNNFLKTLVQKNRIEPSKIKILSSNTDFEEIKKKQINFFKTIQLQDLIRRNVSYDMIYKTETYEGEVILVTGAGGSIGSVLTKKLLNNKPKSIICLDSSEENLFNLKNTLDQNLELLNFCKVNYVLSNLNSKKIIENLFHKYKISTVYHAAAYKHVNIVEENKVSSTINNLCSFLNLIRISIKFKVKYFAMISSDKAVNPKSFMGLTKKICEQILIYYSKFSTVDKQNKYFIVRFGNVFESSGSVIPIFKKQIESGGPVTITSFDATRYFMSISEAVNLILQAKSISKGSEIFILEMGEPIKIIEIAKKLIFLHPANKQFKKNIQIKEIGLRKGEKLHEELTEGEVAKTAIKNILIAKEKNLKEMEIVKIINILDGMHKAKDMDICIKDLISYFKLKY